MHALKLTGQTFASLILSTLAVAAVLSVAAAWILGAPYGTLPTNEMLQHVCITTGAVALAFSVAAAILYLLDLKIYQSTIILSVLPTLILFGLGGGFATLARTTGADLLQVAFAVITPMVAAAFVSSFIFRRLMTKMRGTC